MIYGNYPTTSNGLSGLLQSENTDAVWILVLAIVGAFLAYFMFVKTGKKPANKFLEWLKDFLDFQAMFIESILKIAYIFTALYITLTSFSLIGTSFVVFLKVLVLGNIFIRVIFEAIMVLISIWQNTKEINKKMK